MTSSLEFALVLAVGLAMCAGLVILDGMESGWNWWRRAVVAVLAFPLVFLVYRAVLGGGV